MQRSGGRSVHFAEQLEFWKGGVRIAITEQVEAEAGVASMLTMAG